MKSPVLIPNRETLYGILDQLFENRSVTGLQKIIEAGVIKILFDHLQILAEQEVSVKGLSKVLHAALAEIDIALPKIVVSYQPQPYRLELNNLIQHKILPDLLGKINLDLAEIDLILHRLERENYEENISTL